MISLLAIILVSYLAGSFTSGIVLGKVFAGVDVREHGSKNLGATNVFRVLGPKIAIPVLLLDMAKGVVAVLVISHINFGDLSMDLYWLKIIAGLSAISGHLFPVWLKFKGGKGVAAGGGVLFGLMPLEVGFGILLFAIIVLITRYVSLGSILATFFIFCALLAEKAYLMIDVPKPYMLLAFLLTAMVIYTHRTNITRLLKGEEHKIGAKTAN